MDCKKEIIKSKIKELNLENHPDIHLENIVYIQSDAWIVKSLDSQNDYLKYKDKWYSMYGYSNKKNSLTVKEYLSLYCEKIFINEDVEFYIYKKNT